MHWKDPGLGAGNMGVICPPRRREFLKIKIVSFTSSSLTLAEGREGVGL